MPAPTNPVAGGATEHKILSTNRFEQEGIVANDQNLKPGTFLSLASGKLKAFATGEVCEGVSKGFIEVDTNTYNKNISYKKSNREDLYIIPVVAGTIAVADINKFYQLNAEHQIAGGTVGVATATANTPVQLVEVITTTKGVFRITQ